MTWIMQALMGVAGLCAAMAATGGVFARMLHHQAVVRREHALRSAVGDAEGIDSIYSRSDSLGSACLGYMRRLSMRLSTGAIPALAPCVRSKKAARTRSGTFFASHALAAGMEGTASVDAFCEMCFRLSLIGGTFGTFFGVLFSNEMAVLLGALGLAFGYVFPFIAVRRQEVERGLEAGRHLSEMLEVVALGLRSGLTFDRSFALYGQHFDSGFAQSCAAVCQRWSLGLSTREEALRVLARSYSCKQLEQVIESVIRGLKLGTSLTEPLEEFAAQARLSYRTELEERVAKAPVKMMLPTGTLILPAMLLLVMGPILLELTQGF